MDDTKPVTPPYDAAPRPGLHDRDIGSGPDVREAVSIFLRHKGKIILILLISMAVAWFQLSKQIPVYSARAEIVLEGTQSPIDLGVLLGQSTRVNRREIENELLILESRPLLARVVEEMDLLSDAEFNRTAGIRPQPVWTEWLRPHGLWPITLDWSEFPPRLDMGNEPEPPILRQDNAAMRAAVNRLRAKVKTGIVKGTTVLWVRVRAWTPEKAARLTNAVADIYIAERIRARVQAQREASKFIGEQVVELREEVELAEAAVQAFRSENGVVNAGNEALIAYEELRSRTEISTNLERSLQTRLDRFAQVLASGAGLQAAARELDDTRLNTLAASGLTDRLAREVDVVRSQLETNLIRARERATVLADALANMEAALKIENANLVRLRQLEREAAASRLLFETFLARQKETAAQQQLVSADARVINPAEAPRKPAAPDRRRHYIIALMIGTLLAALLVYVIERARHRFMTAEELEAWSGYTVLGSVPRFPRVRRRGEILKRVQQQPGGSLAEAIRNLRTSILLANVDTPPKVIVVTSSIPEEGKSLTAMLLTMVTAQMGKRALIIDTDIRRRTIHNTIRADAEPGLIALLEGRASFDDAVRVDEKSGLHAMPVERTQASAPDLLSSDAFKRVLEEARSRYDLVLLDAPPVLPVTDARILGTMADALVYAVKWNDTPKSVVKNGLESLINLGVQVDGLVLTQVDRKKQRDYGYGYYGYGSYKYYRKAGRYYTD